MAGAKSYAHANQIINAYLRGGATPYIALASAVADGDASSFTELVGNGYARQAVVFAAPTNGITSNTNTVSFGAASAPWLNATYALVMSAATGGTLLYYGLLFPAKLAGTGETIELPPGAVSIDEQ